MVVVGCVVRSKRDVVGLDVFIENARVETLQRQSERGVACKAETRGVAGLEDLVKPTCLVGHDLLRLAVGGESRRGHIGGQREEVFVAQLSFQSEDEVLLRPHTGTPPLIDGALRVVGTKEVEVDTIAALTVACRDSPTVASVLWNAGGGIIGVVIDGAAQHTIEGGGTELLVAPLQSHTIERHVEHILGEGHRRLADVGGEVLVRRTEVERELGIAEVQVVVREVDRERHREPVDVKVEIGEEAIAQRRHISQPGRAVEVGVVGTYGAGDDERVALGYLRNVLRADGRNGPRAGHQNGC